MNKFLLRIWTGIFISIVIITSVAYVMIFDYYGSFFANPEWYPVSSTALLVQKIMDETPPEKIESERAYLSLFLERSIHVYSSGDDALPEIAKQLSVNGEPVFGMAGDGKRFFWAPVHDNNLIVAVDPSFNLYAPFPSHVKFFIQLVWIFIITAAGGFLLSRPINKRLIEFEFAAEKIHSRDFSARIETIASDLIGEVGICFNQMADRIQTMVLTQQTILSGFVGKLETANNKMIGHLNDLPGHFSGSGRAIWAKNLSAILDELEQFVGNLLRSQKNSGYAAGSEPDEIPSAGVAIGDHGIVFDKNKAPFPRLFFTFAQRLTGFKSFVFQAGILKFVMRVAIGILVTLLFNHGFGIISSQFAYKYMPGIPNWYPARILPALIQHTVDAAESKDASPLIVDLQKSLHRKIDLVATEALSPLAAHLEIKSGNGITYGAYEGKQVYFAPVHGGSRTVIIDNGLDLYRHIPSLLLHLTLIPGELLLTVIGSMLLSWPIIRRMKELEKALNGIRQGDLDTRVRIPAGKPIGNLAKSFNDMAERIQLLITNRKHLIQAVAHEIRTPVYRIHFHLEMMLRDNDIDAVTRRINNIREDIEELNGLAEELRMFTEIEGWRYKNEKISVRKELFDIVSHYKKTISHLSITLVGIPDDSAAIHAHPVYFRRVIQNVLSNAIRHAQTQVILRHGVIKSVVFIEICDDGPGVPPHAREAVFEPFTRLDDSRNRNTGGYGLGLAITRRILSLYHGAISISDNMPRGAKFTIHWPLCNPADGSTRSKN